MFEWWSLHYTENYKHITIYIKSIKTHYYKYSTKINPLQRMGICASPEARQNSLVNYYKCGCYYFYSEIIRLIIQMFLFP
jgi:hypothetical protein